MYKRQDQLREIEGFENARYVDPYAGGKGNSIRYLSVVQRTDGMLVRGAENVFCGGEKSGLFVGHTEAITTGSLAGYNACLLYTSPFYYYHNSFSGERVMKKY